MPEESGSEPNLPRLRPVEILPVTHQGRRLILLRDPTGIAADPLLLSPASVTLLSFFDGRHTVRDIQLAAARGSGQIIPAGQIHDFAAKLEANHFLDSPGYRRHREQLRREYAAADARQAQFAGHAYPADPRALLDQISSYYRGPGGRGLPVAAVRRPPLAIAAPHIDPARGGPVYAAAYAGLWGARVEGVVVLGVSHAGGRHPFIVTAKDYTTPLGRLRVSKDRLAALAAGLDWDPDDQEELHRWEHSIEFQLIFLQHALGEGRLDGAVDPGRDRGKAGPELLPILCAFSWEDLALDAPGGRRARIDGFLDHLRGALDDSGRAWLIVAGVDLAHVGPRFGDAEPLSAQMQIEVHRRDREMLETLVSGDTAGFIEDLARDRNARRICGLGALYALAKLMEGRRGEIVGYDQSADAASGSLVSFAALVYSAG